MLTRTSKFLSICVQNRLWNFENDQIQYSTFNKQQRNTIKLNVRPCFAQQMIVLVADSLRNKADAAKVPWW